MQNTPKYFLDVLDSNKKYTEDDYKKDERRFEVTLDYPFPRFIYEDGSPLYTVEAIQDDVNIRTACVSFSLEEINKINDYLVTFQRDRWDSNLLGRLKCFSKYFFAPIFDGAPTVFGVWRWFLDKPNYKERYFDLFKRLLLEDDMIIIVINHLISENDLTSISYIMEQFPNEINKYDFIEQLVKVGTKEMMTLLFDGDQTDAIKSTFRYSIENDMFEFMENKDIRFNEDHVKWLLWKNRDPNLVNRVLEKSDIYDWTGILFSSMNNDINIVKLIFSKFKIYEDNDSFQYGVITSITNAMKNKNYNVAIFLFAESVERIHSIKNLIINSIEIIARFKTIREIPSEVTRWYNMFNLYEVGISLQDTIDSVLREKSYLDISDQLEIEEAEIQAELEYEQDLEHDEQELERERARARES